MKWRTAESFKAVEKKVCVETGEMFFWSCNKCGQSKPCIHCAETKGWLPKECVRMVASVQSDTMKVIPEWTDMHQEMRLL